MNSERENCAPNSGDNEFDEPRTVRIRQLNDQLRQTGVGGRILITHGIEALGPAILCPILEAVRQFDAFSPGNDPYGEHDFGSLTWAGHKVFFKIDCYENGLQFGSPDSADPDVTSRVITIMLASEY